MGVSSKGQSQRSWLSDAVVYQVYPRSFKDTSGDGMGDLKGVAQKVNYIKELGADAIWLNPFYPSPLVDGGYDVADYRDVDPRLGTMDDFDELTRKAHEVGLKVVVDIVPNHCSDRHPWFQEALNSEPGSAARERFIFRDGRGEHGELPPTNWTANFGGSTWTRVKDGQWYLHLFTPAQPDWNWQNPEVREYFLGTLRFWCDHGADGFRVDVAHGLAKDLNRDDLDSYGVDMASPMPEDGSHPVWDRDEVHDIYREWHKVFEEYNPPRSAVAEAWVPAKRQHLYARKDELGQVFNFEFAKANWTFRDMHRAIEEGMQAAWESDSGATWVMSNHDTVRVATRYALPQVPSRQFHQIATDWVLRDGHSYYEDREAGARRVRAALMLEMALPGSAYIYQGEELGLYEVADIPWDQLEDPVAKNSTQSGAGKGRDGCRVPLPWTAGDEPKKGGSFGFSPVDAAPGVQKGRPHLPQPDWFADYAVDVEEGSSDSMLSFYRKTLSLRHRLMATKNDFEWLSIDGSDGVRDGADGAEGGVIAYRRSNGWANVTNFGSTPVELPKGEVLLVSGQLQDGKLPQDCSAWILLKDEGKD